MRERVEKVDVLGWNKSMSVFRLNSHSSWTLSLLRRIFAYYVRWLDADISTSAVTFFKVLSEIWISLFAVGILFLPSIQFLSKLITPLHFSERIHWALIALFFSYFLVEGLPWIQLKKSVFKSSCDSGLTRWICSSNNIEASIYSVVIIWVSLPSLHFLNRILHRRFLILICFGII